MSIEVRESLSGRQAIGGGAERAISRLVAAAMAVALCAPLGCGADPPGRLLAKYRVEIEAILERPSNEPTPPVRLPLPPRRERRLEVGDQRIGPFDFLSIIGCPLSELVAARNASLGKVLVPTRRLAHEVAVLKAIDECLPTLPKERASRLRSRAASKRVDLPAHVWNAVWLDADLERFLSSGLSALVGRGDPSDGTRQLARAASAVDALDVEALESAFHALRDDAAIGPRLADLALATRELDRVTELMSSLPESGAQNGCDRRARRLSRAFEARYLTLQSALGALLRSTQEVLASLDLLYRASATDGVSIPNAMREFRRDLLEDAQGRDLSVRFRTAIVDHATAWGPVLDACNLIPGRPA